MGRRPCFLLRALHLRRRGRANRLTMAALHWEFQPVSSIALTPSRLKRGAAGLLLALACVTAAMAGAKEDIQADLKAGRWLSAEQRLQKVLEKHPENALAHYWHAQVLLKLDRRPQAKQELQAALNNDPELKFASDKNVLSQLARELGVSLPGASSGPQLVETPTLQTAPVAQAPQPVAVPRAAPRPVERKSSNWPMFLGIGAIFLVLWLWLRKKNQAADKGDIVASLRGAHSDLQAAVKASDANTSLSQEQKLANYDLVRATQARLDQYASKMQSGSPSAAEIAEAEAAVWQARDLAADLRGEERPSLRRSREQQMRHEQAMARAQNQPGPGGYGYGAPQGGGIGLGTAAAVGVGAALLTNAVLGSSRESHGHRDNSWNDDNRSRDNSPGFDLGGSGGDFDSGGGGDFGGGGDSGGGGGDFD